MKGKMAKVLSHFDEYTNGKSTVKSFVADIENNIQKLLKKQNPNITSEDDYLYKDDIKKCLKKLSKSIEVALSDVYEVELKHLKSETINIDVLSSMPDEVNTIKAGDTVIVIYSDGGIGKKRYIIEMEVFELDFLTEKGRLGISSYESPFSAMIDITWCELVVKKESYLQALQLKKN